MTFYLFYGSNFLLLFITISNRLYLTYLFQFYFRLDTKEPKHGKEDPKNEPHVGGNTWAGGTGGRDTAGLGGKGGPYRLDKGHKVHQVCTLFSSFIFVIQCY